MPAADRKYRIALPLLASNSAVSDLGTGMRRSSLVLGIQFHWGLA